MITSRCRWTVASLAVSTLTLALLSAVDAPALAQTPAAVRLTVTELDAPGAGVAINDLGDVLTVDTGSFEVDSYLVPHGGAAIRLLGDENTESATAFALNVHGVSVGNYLDFSLFGSGATWTRRGVVRNVRTFPGADAGQTSPVDINDSGALVGTAYYPAANADVATRWSAAGVPTRVDPSATGVDVTAINNQGVVSGRVGARPALFGPGTQVRALGRLSGETFGEATGLTDSGLAFGDVTIGSSTVPTPVVWSSTGHATRLTRPAGTVSATVVSGNIHGVLVGTATRSNGDSVAVEWLSPTRPVVLPQLSTATSPSIYQANSINDLGVIAGSTVMQPGEGGYTVPLVWTPVAATS